MKWTDEDIDHLFQKAASDQEVVYKDEYWQEMAAILDAQAPKKKRVGWWFFTVLASVILFPILIYYGIQVADKKSNLSLLSAEDEFLELVNIENQKGLSRTYQSSEMQFIVELKEHQSNLMVRKQPRSLMELSDYEYVLINLNPKITVYEKVDGYWNLKPAPLRPLTMQYAPIGNVEKPIEHTEETTRVNTKKGKVKVATVRSAETATKNKELLVEVNQTLQEPEVPHEVLEVDELVKIQSLNDPSIERGRIGYFFGAGAGAGNSYFSESKSMVTNWYFNAGMDYTFRNRIRLGLGLGFKQEIMNDMHIHEKRDYYSMSVVTLNRNIEYDRMNFIDLNVYFQYAFQRITIGLDVTPTFLLGARSTMTQKLFEGEEKIHVEGASSFQDQFVQTDYLNMFGVNLGVDFQYNFFKGFAVNLGASTRLNQLVNTHLFQEKSRKFPMRFEVGIVKRF